MSVAAAWVPKLIPRLRVRPQVDPDATIVRVARARALTERRAEELRAATLKVLEAVDDRAQDGLE